MYKVYVHVNKANNKRYVGITSQATNERWRGGGSGYKNNKYFWNAIQKYGWNNFDHYVLFDGLDIKTASAIEQKLIAEFKSNNRLFGYNNSVGGEKPALGHTVKHTEETKRKMSVAHTGFKHSAESIEKMRKAQKGKIISREQAKAVSEARSIPIMCVETGVIYRNAHDVKGF